MASPVTDVPPEPMCDHDRDRAAAPERTGPAGDAPHAELLRLATTGSVDDGKSTLLGQLLYGTKSLFDDQLEAVEAISAARGSQHTDLALFTDGLRAERDQGITIDVAYRGFATPRRRFIIADTPGHIQYTRNMVTGASTADLALIIVDARTGLVEQSRRHAILCSLLRVPRLVLCVNKMDLAGWSEAVYRRISDDFAEFAAQLEGVDPTVIPVSALHGDNVVSPSANMPWYDGPTLLGHLEDVPAASTRNFADARFPVQYVIGPDQSAGSGYHGYAGQVASGVLRTGEEVLVLPSGRTSVITAIETADGSVPEAFPPMSVVLRLAGQPDLVRGDMICRPSDAPAVTHDLEATVCWMDERLPLTPGRRFVVKHTTRMAEVGVRDLAYRLDVNSLRADRSATSLSLNEIGRIRLSSTVPLMCDEYSRNRVTGSLIIIDQTTNATVGAGMVTSTT
jgi:bifunctional enzyme CysN/CysC